MFFSFSPSLAASIVLSPHRSAQQRSSQTNKSQSSAGNQVSICHVLSVIRKQQNTRSKTDCTPTQQDGSCRESKLKWKRCDANCTFISVNLFALQIFYVMFSLGMFLNHINFILALHAVLCWAPVVYSGFVCFFGFIILSRFKKKMTLGSITLCHHHR